MSEALVYHTSSNPNNIELHGVTRIYKVTPSTVKNRSAIFDTHLLVCKTHFLTQKFTPPSISERKCSQVNIISPEHLATHIRLTVTWRAFFSISVAMTRVPLGGLGFTSIVREA